MNIKEVIARSAGRKDDAGKPALQNLLRYFPPEALGAVGDVMAGGALQYGERNWEDEALDEQRILGAVLRHTGSHLRGITYDGKSTKRHLAHAAASALMALSKSMGVCQSEVLDGD